jgi:transposase-like protein
MDRHLVANNRRNGYGRKTALTGYGQIDPDVPLGRQSRFGAQLPPRCRRRLPDFDHEVISMQVRDIIMRKIPEHFRDLCKLGVLSGAEAVPDRVVAWQVRPQTDPPAGGLRRPAGRNRRSGRGRRQHRATVRAGCQTAGLRCSVACS